MRPYRQNSMVCIKSFYCIPLGSLMHPPLSWTFMASQSVGVRNKTGHSVLETTNTGKISSSAEIILETLKTGVFSRTIKQKSTMKVRRKYSLFP